MFEDIGNPGSCNPSLKHLYTTPHMLLDHKKLNQLYNDILQPLTLFPSTISTPGEAEDPGQKRKSATLYKSDIKEEVDETVCTDGTYTCYLSVDDVTLPKYSPDALCELVKRKLRKISALGIGSTAIQQIFEKVILTEVKVISESIPHVIHTTLLTASEKQHLHQRLLSHIIIVSEQLFMFYLHKIEWYKTQTIFSEEATLTRLKAQLLLDCAKFLNVYSVRRHLIAELKEIEGKEVIYNDPDEVSEERRLLCSEYIDQKKVNFNSNKPHFTMGHFIRLGRPKPIVHKLQRETDLMQIEKIQNLDLKKAYMLIPTQEDNSEFLRNVHCAAFTTPCPYISSEDLKLEESHPGKVSVLKKCISCPNLRVGDLLADELQIAMKVRSSECPDKFRTGKSIMFEDNFVSEDLKWLLQASKLPCLHKEKVQGSDEEMPPLIQARCQGGNAARLKRLKALLQAENKKQEQIEEKKVLKTHLHPQAYSLDVKIPNKPLLRRADVQASERIFTDLIEVAKYPPVYNEFTSEIEIASVKRLDGKLIAGQDLQDVYAELAMHLSKDHLNFEQGVTTEPFATNVDFSKCVSSSTLAKNKNQRVINKELYSIASIDNYKSLTQPVPFDKEAAKICNSWLVWWKSAINSDDYIKFVSTQDVDYLKVIHHLYSSDSEEEAQACIALMKKQEEQKRKREKKITDLRAEKQNHIPGMWNVNSVMLGGLGRDPVLPDEEQERKKTESPLQPHPSLPQELYQKRINAVWDIFCISNEQRLDMAIKYSSNEYQELLEKAINMWEKAATLIQKREDLLAKLEMFERDASDPNRFFQKGYEGTGMARIKECKERKKLHTQMANIEPEIQQVIRLIKKLFNDTVTFKGRPYEEKMQWDKTEMLYFLQQNRRKTLIERDITNDDVKLELIN